MFLRYSDGVNEKVFLKQYKKYSTELYPEAKAISLTEKLPEEIRLHAYLNLILFIYVLKGIPVLFLNSFPI